MHYTHLLMHSKVTTRTVLNPELVTANGLLESAICYTLSGLILIAIGSIDHTLAAI